MRILELRAENFLRLSVVNITPEGNVIQITGANGQGKSSTIGAIWAAIGGADGVPEKPIRKGKDKSFLRVTIGEPGDIQFIVEKTITAKGEYLTVTDAAGSKYKSPQQILNGFVGKLGYDVLEFMRLKPKDQFEVLRGLVKLDEDLDALDRKRATIYEQRTGVNRDLERAKSVAASIVVPDDLPEQEPDIAAITDRLAGVDSHNSIVRARHVSKDQAIRDAARAREEEAGALAALEAANKAAKKAQERAISLEAEAGRMAKLAGETELQDVTAIRSELDAANRIAEGFRKQRSKIEADAAVTTHQRDADGKTAEIEAIDARKKAAISGAQMPVDGLSFSEGIVTFNGMPLAQASSAEQLRVSASIGAALNPKLRVLLARDGSLLDSKSLAALATFAEEKDLQIWLEKVDESGEVGVVLVDGHVKGQEAEVEAFEAAEVRGQDKETGKLATVVDPERIKRANEYLDGALEKASACTELQQADLLDADVRAKLKHFPDLIASKWAPAYKALVKELGGR